MQLYCPTCQANQAGSGRCPKCGDRLITAAEAFATTGITEALPALPPLIQPSAPGRVAIGIVVSLGVYLGLRDWSAAGLILAELDVIEPWMTVLLMILSRVIAVMFGGLLAGAGRPQGAVTGVAVGAACGGLFSSIDVFSGHPSNSRDVLIGLGLAVASGICGHLGCKLWPPALEKKHWKKVSTGSSLLRMAQEEHEERNSPPMQWVRIFVAIVILIGGVTFTDQMREGMRKIRVGPNSIAHANMASLFNVQIAGMLVSLAGFVAGASTGAGLRHGFITGIFGGLGVVGILTTGSPYPLPALEGLVKISMLPIGGVYSAEAGMLVFFSILILTAVCAWFLAGSQASRVSPGTC